MNKLLSSNLKPADQKTPILSRSKSIAKRIDEEKLEYKTRKAISAEKNKNLMKDRVKVELDIEKLDYERNLRKIATSGVVQLFNAIRTSQQATDEVIKSSGGIQRLTTKATKDVTSMSKETFLDMLKNGKTA
ncbi:9705_t:CDS:2 [Entrophospora sp. SA101]|nr:2126_t:CDS:2 [Entrophospora candida]CAH1759811.1 11376_t:CDS:2 [Entrophospora sp. SA101]CAG8564971.1 2543_t:CDS:2 [Entrophospora candida]CAJ0643924.1 9700_t:CDS:2 [Entrophospora sp. SA101]CAJ0643928.1 9703_t:CDS:2 [Entrophospora sp. SA101]